MIAKSLHRAGYEVDTCNDGEKALDMIYAEMYDLIVLDLNLPGVDGMELIRRAKELRPDLVFIVVSGYRQFEYA